MSYYPSEAVIDLIAACGPQELHDCVRECRNQCFPYLNQREVATAIAELENAGIIEGDVSSQHPTYWDFTDYGFELLASGRANG